MGTDKQRIKNKLFRGGDCRPEEIFVSEALRYCIVFEEIYMNFALEFDHRMEEKSYYYRIAGKIFYICLWFIHYCEKINNTKE